MYSKVVRLLGQPLILGLRNQLALVLAFIALLAATWAIRVGSRPSIASSEASCWKDRQFEQVWLSREGQLTGARLEQNRLVMQRVFAGGAWKEVSVRLAPEEGGENRTVWAVSESGDELAWADGKQVHFAKLDYLSGSYKKQGSLVETEARFLHVPSPETVQIFCRDGSVRAWNVSEGRVWSEPELTFEAAEQVVGRGQYLAVASSRHMTLYRNIETRPRIIDQTEPPAESFRLVLPAAGQMAALSATGIFIRGKRIHTPGAVRTAVIAPDQTLLAAGDFPGIQVCTEQGCEVKFGLNGVTALVANQQYVAYSGPEGTGLLRFTQATTFTKPGQFALALAGLAALSSFLLATSGFMRRKVTRILEQERRRKANLPDRFEIPEGLLEAFRQGKVVLWAGSGLSAQAGLPTRSAFIRYLIEAAETEGWIDSSGMITLLANAKKGRGEECVAAIAERLADGCNHELQPFVRTMYRRITLMTPAFEWLRKLPFSAAFTTNYDTTLERMGPRWEAGVVPMPYNPLSAIKSHQFFVWKLYGDVQTNTPLLLSRFDLAETLERISVTSEIVDRICRTRVLFFVGASLSGLIQDLRILGFRSAPGVTHYAFAAVQDASWKREAQLLLKEFGVRAIIVAEDAVAKALPELLQSLVERLAQMPARQAAPAVTSGESRQRKIQAAG
ncbi:MAG: SIR2 family protein [Bryobacteraceae bacterium]|nr:SIR2 family protein [Bryobacteraceae bacterium]MDW8377174.1 SIR2 family protein [Bryobacterales bacterium]